MKRNAAVFGLACFTFLFLIPLAHRTHAAAGPAEDLNGNFNDDCAKWTGPLVDKVGFYNKRDKADTLQKLMAFREKNNIDMRVLAITVNQTTSLERYADSFIKKCFVGGPEGRSIVVVIDPDLEREAINVAITEPILKTISDEAYAELRELQNDDNADHFSDAAKGVLATIFKKAFPVAPKPNPPAKPKTPSPQPADLYDKAAQFIQPQPNERPFRKEWPRFFILVLSSAISSH
ncbi:MAG TPA: TPM domain-containing protein [Candidatus Paceibacterota bacterium]|jgi:hypothetical protein|nr:TPM domain-containing protein [Candidatus Paceibacterota bacterium]